MSIRNLKDGSKTPWICERYPKGRSGSRVRKKFATKGEATAYELFVMKQVDDKPWMGEKADDRRLSEILELWFKLHGKNLKSGKHTRDRLQHIVTALDDPIAAQLTPRHLAHYRAQRTSMRAGKEHGVAEISINSSNKDMVCLKAMFNKLIELDEWRFPNPIDKVKRLKAPATELTFLRDEQIERLFKFIKKARHADQMRMIFKICLATGARINEAIELHGEYVYDNKITFVHTKSKQNRTLPISQELYDEINPTKSGRLFTISYLSTQQWINKALPELPRGQATHVLRHTFATAFMRNGGNILDLKAALGHSSIEQTMIYAHFSPNHLSAIVHLNPIATLSI